MSSKYIPYLAQVYELEQQQKRKAFGLKSGFYVKYPPEATDYFVVKASQMNEEFIAEMDQRLAIIAASKTKIDSTGGNK